MSEKSQSEQYPSQVEHLVTDDKRAILEEWEHKPLDEIVDTTPELTVVRFGDDRLARVGILPALTPEKSETSIVLGLEHQQVFSPAHMVRARLMQTLIAPEHDVIVMPNNMVRSANYTFTPEEREILKSGDFTPMAEMQSRILSALQLGPIALTGYSFGARAAVELAALGDHDVKAVNADEAPTRQFRTPKELQKAFLASGGWGEQRAAVSDSEIDAMAEAYATHLLAMDYARFGIAAGFNKDNQALRDAMQGSMARSVVRAIMQNPDAMIKLGAVEGSELTDLAGEDIKTALRYSPDQVRAVHYSGPGTRRHATSNNVVAHALLAEDGIGHVLGK